MEALITPILIGLFVLNVVTFAAFGYDKAMARRSRRRISERTLLVLALMGGSVGALLGRKLFRHKTHKQPFVRVLFGIVVIQLAFVAGLVFWAGKNLI